MLKEHPNSLLFSQPATRSAQVTVCISLYNYQDYIVETLETVREQTLELLDLIVVEDRSTDDSLIVAGSWLKQNAERFNRVELVRHEQNSGLPRARNTAIARTQTPYVFILDADNLLYPCCIERCLEVIEDDPHASLSYPIIEKFGSEQTLMGNVNWERSQFLKQNCIDAMSLIRKASLNKVKGYSYLEAVGPLGWEDYELWCKFFEAGLYGILVPEILARYRTHKNSMLHSISNRAKNIKHLHREMLALHPWLKLEKL